MAQSNLDIAMARLRRDAMLAALTGLYMRDHTALAEDVAEAWRAADMVAEQCPPDVRDALAAEPVALIGGYDPGVDVTG